jgi:hypothetical protein
LPLTEYTSDIPGVPSSSSATSLIFDRSTFIRMIDVTMVPSRGCTFGVLEKLFFFQATFFF